MRMIRHPWPSGIGLLAAALVCSGVSTSSLSFSAFLGGSNFDQVYALAVDAAGNVYVTGQTASANFPTRTGGQDGNKDVFVAKLNPAGTSLTYLKILGGAQTDTPRGLAVDASGNVYVTGFTSSTDFPTTAGAYRTTSGGNEDAFVFKLNSSGVLVYSTYLGGSGRDFATAIAIDVSGSAYVTGYTSSTNFPIVAGAVQAAYGGGFNDVFVAKLNPAGTALVYSTFLGGIADDTASSIAVDAAGNAYLCGETNSSNFPVSSALQATNAGGQDAFVAKLNPTASALVFSTYLGGSLDDFANSIAVDSSQNVYVAGATASFDFPVSATAYQRIFGGGAFDAFATKLASSGATLSFSSLLGGSGSDQANGLSVDSAGNVWLTGSTTSTNLPLVNALQALLAGGSDVFVATLNSTGDQLLYSSYLGGGSDDSPVTIAIDNKGSELVGGVTQSSGFTTTPGAVQPAFGGSYDGFVFKLQTGICPYSLSANALNVTGAGGSGSITASAAAGCSAPTASSNVAWAVVSVVGSSVNWTIAANTSSIGRTGALTVAGQTVIVTQAGLPCSYNLNPAILSVGSAGGAGNITVTPSPLDCPAAAASSGVAWASVSVTGTIASWSVSANPSSLARSGNLTIGGKTAGITQSGAATATPGTLTLNRTVLNFGTSGSLVTSSQSVVVGFAAGSGVAWTVSSSQPNITAAPGGGTGAGSFTVSAVAGASGTVTVTAPGAASSPLQVQVSVKAVTPANPLGSFDTPPTGKTGIAGGIAVTGWALDNIEVTKVDIWREPGPGEPAGLAYIGDAVFVADARTDIDATFPTLPFQYRGGWGYLMLTNFLPSNGASTGLGNGSYVLHAIAHNAAGNSLDLGTSAITVDNAHATKPFGTIDLPGQGATASGNAYVNFAWALTQIPYNIPTDGSTLSVILDGRNLGRPSYNHYRSDIANLFPGLANSNGAIGYFFLDTTTLANGVHTISWVVSDNQGRTDGIGSRFFSVLNGGNASPVAAEESLAMPAGGPIDVLDVEMDELERIELPLGTTTGYLLVNGQRRTLPIGSSIQGGVFYWQALPGFLGEYQLGFERPGAADLSVHVKIRPKRFP